MLVALQCGTTPWLRWWLFCLMWFDVGCSVARLDGGGGWEAAAVRGGVRPDARQGGAWLIIKVKCRWGAPWCRGLRGSIFLFYLLIR